MKTYSKTALGDELLQYTPCPVCGNDNSSPIWKVDGACFARCKGCGLVQQNPRPKREDFASRYDNEYFQYEIENEESFFRLMMLGLEDIHFFENIAPTLGEEKRILDVGCATGRLLKHFKSLGWRTDGVELCAESANYGNTHYGVDIHVGDLMELDFPDASFSLVHASHLIEHLDNPSAFAAKVADLLIRNGVFICVTPAMDGLQARLFGKQWRSAIPDHITLFTKPTLKKLLENAGLTIEHVATWGGLAIGAAPLWLKKIADRWVKVVGLGDVVLMAARKT